VAVASALLCLVVAIADGDTLTARCGEETVKVRLAEIDAPEKSQPWGQRSKQALSGLCFDQAAELRPVATDRYHRTVARVVCNGFDANAELVRGGMAWAYTRYLTDPGIRAAETQARADRIGLWSETDPTPPWVWRHRKR